MLQLDYPSAGIIGPVISLKNSTNTIGDGAQIRFDVGGTLPNATIDVITGVASSSTITINTNSGGTLVERVKIDRYGKFTVHGLVESTSGGIKFPDGTIQNSAVSGGNISRLVSPFSSLILTDDTSENSTLTNNKWNFTINSTATSSHMSLDNLSTVLLGENDTSIIAGGNSYVAAGGMFGSFWLFEDNGTIQFPSARAQRQKVRGTTTFIDGNGGILPHGGPSSSAHLIGGTNGIIYTTTSNLIVGVDLTVRAHDLNHNAITSVTEISKITAVRSPFVLDKLPQVTVYGQVSSNNAISFTSYNAKITGGNCIVIVADTAPHGFDRYFTYQVTEYEATL